MLHHRGPSSTTRVIASTTCTVRDASVPQVLVQWPTTMTTMPSTLAAQTIHNPRVDKPYVNQPTRSSPSHSPRPPHRHPPRQSTSPTTPSDPNTPNPPEVNTNKPSDAPPTSSMPPFPPLSYRTVPNVRRPYSKTWGWGEVRPKLPSSKRVSI